MMKINEIFEKNPHAAIAFSGGVDSAYLLYEAVKYADKVCAYYVKTDFQPQFELDDALRLAKELGAEMKILTVDILAEKAVADNPLDRCYYCKRKLMSVIWAAAEKDGYPAVFDGTNASDQCADRPGMRALAQLHVLSPLRMCGLTKEQIRQRSKEAGLFTWNKPAYACLATRILSGQPISKRLLVRTQRAEEMLASFGFTDFRVRTVGETARIEVTEEELPLLLKNRKEISERLLQEYEAAVLDLEVR